MICCEGIFWDKLRKGCGCVDVDVEASGSIARECSGEVRGYSADAPLQAKRR